MSAEASGEKQADIRYDTADASLRRRSVELVRGERGTDVRWYLRLQSGENVHETTFEGLKSRPSNIPAALKRHLAGISGGEALEPEQQSPVETTDDDGGRLTDAADAPAALALTLADLSDQLLVCDLAVRLDLPDAIHQLRLTCRRLRSLLKAAAPFLDSSRNEDLDSRLRDLGRRCAPARDAEVIAQSLSAGTALIGDALTADSIDRLQKRALRQSALASQGVRRYLQRKAHLDLLADVQAFAAHPPVTEALTGRSSRWLANRLLRRTLRNLNRVASQPPEGLGTETAFTLVHDVRKAVKRVRYVASVLRAAEVRPKKKLRQAAKDASKYQRQLGEILDLGVLLSWLERTADEKEGETDRYAIGLLQGAAIIRFSEELKRSEVLIDELAAQLEGTPRSPS